MGNDLKRKLNKLDYIPINMVDNVGMLFISLFILGLLKVQLEPTIIISLSIYLISVFNSAKLDYLEGEIKKLNNQQKENINNLT